MLEYGDVRFIFVIVEIDWKEVDSYNGYREDRSIIAACEELDDARRYVEECADIFDKPFKWSDDFNFYYYEDNGTTSYGTRFTIKTVRLL